MPTILALETALGECSAALWKEDHVLAEVVETTRNRQTTRALPMVEEVLAQAGIPLAEVNQFVTTSGPGSFTGLRIGLAVMRAFTLATHKPTLAVSTLELLAWQGYELAAEKENHTFCTSCVGVLPQTPPLPSSLRFAETSRASPCSGVYPTLEVRWVYFISVLNAYRGEVYLQVFRYENQMQPVTPPTALTVADAAAIIQKYAAQGLLIGDAIHLFADIAITKQEILPSAAALARYAGMHRLDAAAYPPQPLYIRAPDAKVQESYLLAAGLAER
jgi:tRNA threonylcarbamoyl adenosine modification protein YeaZ